MPCVIAIISLPESLCILVHVFRGFSAVDDFLVSSITSVFNIAWLPIRPACGLVDLLRRYAVHTSTLFIRAEHLANYPRFPGIIGWETMLLGYLLARGDCAYLDLTVSSYQRHEGVLWHNADRMDRLVRSRQRIDALQSNFFQHFQPELLSREPWIYSLDLALQPIGRRAHWLQSCRVLIILHPRLWLRLPLPWIALFFRTVVQLLKLAENGLRRGAALGTRFRGLRTRVLQP